ncbi:cytochrome b5 reductase 4 isoform X2 [Bacillus rossius redtenbacheri]|uniref:cytochrome b5 reductase 4 isoform X2 n=1 Tax=Bacillus rossius redtenbacheri TaxID=93214 RepID=UPI002FDCD0B3
MEPSDLKQSEDTQRDIFASSKNITETVSSLKLQGTSESLPTSSSSATGNVRNKVSLKPGHSLMDWIRLGQSGIDLTGVKGVLQEVTPSQLARHNKRSDAWLAIRGRVYNVTRYMDFHPGGAEELMKGVGRDATQLFNQVHAWVNFESLLQKCQVGHLRKSESSRLPDLGLLLFKSKKNSKETLNNKPNYSSDNTASAGNPSAEKSSSGRASVPLDWFQTTDSLTLVYYTRSPCPWVDVQLKDSADLTVSVAAGEDRLLSRVRLEGEVSWPCGVVANADTGKVDVRLRKKCARLWRGLGSVCTDDSAPSAAGLFAAWRVVEVLPVTHDTRLIVLRHPDNVHRVVPVGHHVRFVFRHRSVVPVASAKCVHARMCGCPARHGGGAQLHAGAALPAVPRPAPSRLLGRRLPVPDGEGVQRRGAVPLAVRPGARGLPGAVGPRGLLQRVPAARRRAAVPGRRRHGRHAHAGTHRLGPPRQGEHVSENQSDVLQSHSERHLVARSA